MSNPLLSKLLPTLWQELYGPNGLVREQIGSPDIASTIPYTPSTSAHWNPNPTQVAQALDQLAFPTVYQAINGAGQVGFNVTFNGTTVQRRKSGLFLCIATAGGTNAAGAGQVVSTQIVFNDNGPLTTVFTGINAPCAAGPGGLFYWNTMAVALRQALNTANLRWQVTFSNSAPSNLDVPATACNIVTVEL